MPRALNREGDEVFWDEKNMLSADDVTFLLA